MGKCKDCKNLAHFNASAYTCKKRELSLIIDTDASNCDILFEPKEEELTPGKQLMTEMEARAWFTKGIWNKLRKMDNPFDFSDMVFGPVPKQNNDDWSKIFQSQQIEKPPLGLKPTFIWLEERLEEIEEAKIRYKDAGKELPAEWQNEQNFIISLENIVKNGFH
jgi:hypothetical protein